MTYEEKLKKILFKLKEERKLTRKGHKTKVTFNNGSFTKVRIKDICKILLQLQDDENAVKILDAIEFEENAPVEKVITPSDDDDYLAAGIIIVELDKKFDDWYENYLIKEKSRIENISKENFESVFNALTLIENELQVSQSPKITINFVSSMSELDGYDNTDINELIVYYIKALTYLKNQEVIQGFTSEQNSVFSSITINVRSFDEIMEKAKIRAKKPSIKRAQVSITTKASYNPQKGVLKINNKEVKFKKDSFRAKMLELLLKDNKSAKKEWSWDEVIDEIQGTKDNPSLRKENKKKFYPACDGLSKHIAQKIGVNDLLIFTKSTVRINPKYL